MESVLAACRQRQATPAGELQEALCEHLGFGALLVGTFMCSGSFFLCFIFSLQTKTQHCTQVCLHLQGSSPAPMQPCWLVILSPSQNHNNNRLCESGDYVTKRQPIATFVTEDLATTMPAIAPPAVPLVTDRVRFSSGAALCVYHCCSFSLENFSIYSNHHVANGASMCCCGAAGRVYVPEATITRPDYPAASMLMLANRTFQHGNAGVSLPDAHDAIGKNNISGAAFVLCCVTMGRW